MTTEPTNCNEELKRLECADYDLCFSFVDDAIARRLFFVMALLNREWNPDRLNVLFSE